MTIDEFNKTRFSRLTPILVSGSGYYVKGVDWGKNKIAIQKGGGTKLQWIDISLVEIKTNYPNK